MENKLHPGHFFLIRKREKYGYNDSKFENEQSHQYFESLSLKIKKSEKELHSLSPPPKC